MSFTLRFTLGIILVVSTCNTSNGAVVSRHTRQTQFFEDPPENLSLEDVSISDDTSNIKKSSHHVNTTQEVLNVSSENIKNGSIIQNKPKTENITKSYVDNNNNSNVVNIDRNNILNNKLAKINDANERIESSKTVYRKVAPTDFEGKQESIPDTVLKIGDSNRSENGRSLDIDINKYVSDDFHDKNNEYAFSVSPHTDKYTNLENVLLDYEHNISGLDLQYTTTSNYNFDERQQNIERGVEEKLKYIDDRSPIKDNHGIGQFETKSANLRDILSADKDNAFNNTQTNFNYTKYKNITTDESTNKNHVRKELDFTSGQNLDFNSSYIKTETLDNLQSDYKNKILPSENDSNPELSYAITLDRGDISSTIATIVSATKPLQASSPETIFPEILKTSLIQNETGTQKPTLSNNIELDIGNKQTKLKWKTTRPNIFHLLTTANPLRTTNRGQEEELVYVPYSNDATVNVSKRGSTKYTDTIKTTTESILLNRNYVSNKNKSILSNKILVAEKDNISSEPAVQENQMIPIQVVAPVNLTTTIENKHFESSTVPLKPYTVFPNVLTTLKPNKALSDLNDKQTTPINNFDILATSTTETSTSITGQTEEIDSSTYNTLDENTTTEGEVESTMGNGEKITTDGIDLTTDIELNTSTLSQITQDLAETTNPSKSEILSTTNEITVTEIDNTDSSQTTSNTEATKLISPDLWTYMRESSSTDSEDYTPFEKVPTDQRTSSGRNMKTSPSYPIATHQDSTSSLALQVTSTIPTNSNTTETEVTVTDKTEITEAISTASTVDQSDSITSFTQSTNEVIYNKIPTDLNHRQITENSTYPHMASSTQKQTKPHYNESTSESTPLIISLNISIPDPDNVDATTNDSNIGMEERDKEESNSGKIAAIAISCIGAVCLIILATLLFVMRKRHKRFNYGQRCTPVSLDAYSVDNVSVYNSVRRKAALRASKRSYGNLAFDDPSITTNPLNFAALVKFSSNTDAIFKEFEEVPQVTASTSELPDGCETKNRYANVIPLPETRVFLSSIDGQPNNDYINANYVTGPKSSKRYYIACQAPIQNTVDDFWKMVWEQQSKVIIMLTHLFENGAEKCVDYLPPSEVLDCHRLFGDYSVTLKKREVKEKYVISSLHLKNMVSNSWREVTHLWYLGWPEKGVPSEANSLIAFLIEARSYNKSAITVENGKSTESNGTINSEQNPVIVHCSPGTGRTGTVIACDIAIREFELARQVDIPKTVYRIRRDRASAVQTKEQYGFIYEVITLYATKLTGGVLDSL